VVEVCTLKKNASANLPDSDVAVAPSIASGPSAS
jgi:hypothetical protein